METMHAAGRRNLPPVPRSNADSSPAAPVEAAATVEATSPEDARRDVPDADETAMEQTITLPPVTDDDGSATAADGDGAAAAPSTEDGAEDAAEDSAEDVAEDSAEDIAEDSAETDGEDASPDVADAGDTDEDADDIDDAADAAVTDAASEDLDESTGEVDESGAAQTEEDAVQEVTTENGVTEEAVTDAPLLVAVPDADDPAQHFVARLRAAAAEFARAAGAQSAVVREAVPPARHRRSRCRLVLRYADGDEADLTFLGAVGRPGTPAWQDFDGQIRRWLGTGQHREPAWLVEDPEAPDGLAVNLPAWLAAG